MTIHNEFHLLNLNTGKNTKACRVLDCQHRPSPSKYRYK
jgi:hypothetical protein